MKIFAVIVTGMIVVSNSASAQPVLNSASLVTLSTLAPEATEASLSPVQIREINDAVSSDRGLSRSDILRILAD